MKDAVDGVVEVADTDGMDRQISRRSAREPSAVEDVPADEPAASSEEDIIHLLPVGCGRTRLKVLPLNLKVWRNELGVRVEGKYQQKGGLGT